MTAPCRCGQIHPQEKTTPAELQLAGAKSETPSEGETNMSSIAETTDTRTIRQPIEQVDKTVIDKLLVDLAKVPEGKYWAVDEGDPLYTAPSDTVIVLASYLRTPNPPMDEEHYWADYYDMNGRRLPLEERPVEWHREQEKIREIAKTQFTLNAVNRYGDDYLVVGRGLWYAAGETTIDGELAYEFISLKEYLERAGQRRVQERQDFLAANPIVEASMPWWAKDLSIEQGDKVGEVSINYSYSIGVDDLFLNQGATFRAGTLTLDDIEMHNGYNTIPVAEFATVAGELRGFADALDRLAEEGS